MGFISDLFGGGSSSPPAQTVQTVRQTSELPKELRPYYTAAPKGTPYAKQKPVGVLPLAFEQFKTEREYFPGSTVVPFSDLTNQGRAGIESLASGANPLADAAQGGLLDILGGEGLMRPLADIASGDAAIDTSLLANVAGGGLLGRNPYIDELVGRIAGDAAQAVNDDAYLGGREGSPYHAGAVARGIAEATAPIRYADYQAERGHMQDAIGELAGVEGTNIADRLGAAQGGLGAVMQAIGLAPGVDDFQYADANRLIGLGAGAEAKAYEKLQEDVARHNFAQNERADALARYAALVGGSPVLSNSTTQTIAPTPGFSGSGALTGALQGAELGTLLGIPWLGALGGGLLGGYL